MFKNYFYLEVFSVLISLARVFKIYSKRIRNNLQWILHTNAIYFLKLGNE